MEIIEVLLFVMILSGGIAALRSVRRKPASPITRADRWFIQEALDKLISLSSVKRATLVRVENGAGVPRTWGRIYGTVEIQAVKAPFRDVRRKINRLRLDDETKKLLETVVFLGGSKVLATEEMPHCTLRKIYESEGVALAMLSFVVQTERCGYYLSVATDQGGVSGFTSVKDQMEISVTQSRIEDIMKSYQA